MQRIVLTGFMGSGKTTVGRLVAQQLGWRFADLDDVIESRESLTVPEIFAQRGEPAFRTAEAAALAHLLQDTRIVIALGGGAPATPANRDRLAVAPQTAIVHLDAPFDLHYARCAAQAGDLQATSRPLLGERDATERRYTERRRRYLEIAHHTVNAAAEPASVAAVFLATVFL